jgi:ABC-type lipoprotein export system ATPase subunit
MAALEPPTKGEVFGLGMRYGAMNEHELGRFRRRSLGFVFQELSLIPHLTAAENIVAPLLFDHFSRGALRTLRNELLGRVGLAHRASHFPRQLSYGERQRVALARAIVNKPKIVIADEPTANLDTSNVEHVVSILKELCANGTTVIVATHDDVLERAAGRVLRMSDGMLA